MRRYIDADWIVQELEWWRDKLAETHGENDEYVLCLGEVLMKLDNTPTADVRENVRGEWVEQELQSLLGRRHTETRCGNCGYEVYRKTPFCPNCGADTRGEA